ncbi:cupredoxin domain-containing protein [Embleya sp. NPDC020630]|uniref:cupredoxin domain-containing protein n=1 Tax=Embleya sp. NPDC020630 TaxID=3363979 RepID=UPI0037A6687D
MPHLSRRRFGVPGVVLALVWLLFVSGCGGSGGGGAKAHEGASPSVPGNGASGAATITIENFAFSPATVTAAPGAVVTVVNKDSATHTVTADKDKAFDTGNLAGGSTTTFTAPLAPGSYDYLCTIHQYMKAVLLVR